MVALQSGLNAAYDVPEDRKFLKARLVAVAMMVVAVVLVHGLIWAGVVHQALSIGRLIGSQVSAIAALPALGVLTVLTYHMSFNGMESALLILLLLATVRRLPSSIARVIHSSVVLSSPVAAISPRWTPPRSWSRPPSMSAPVIFATAC
jgi:uncharacterized BrkB/YihY/UPF0761 family membrane protein